ncbi:MAG: class I SAM-dependent methyltransferase [Luteibaculaceae bacterium]
MKSKKSIINNNFTAKIVKEVESSKIIDHYVRIGVDVNRFFENDKKLVILECEKTKLKFFGNGNKISGDAQYYADLSSKKDIGYYPKWRWSHDIALKYINKNDKILEIGSGGLGFISELERKGFDILGQEINENSFKLVESKFKNVRLTRDSLNHIASTNQKFSVVCAFEVFEHIYELENLFDNIVELLEKDGTLIFSVPNNTSYLGKIFHPLNLPPHHTVLWEEESIKKLQLILPLKLVKLEFEPLSVEHVNWFLSCYDTKIVNTKFFGGVYLKFGIRNILLLIVKFIRKFLKDQTVVAIFKKI